MSDNELPSIAELQRVNLETHSSTNPYTSFAVRDAAPILMEIAALALAYKQASGRNLREANEDEYWRRCDETRMALFDALRKVRP